MGFPNTGASCLNLCLNLSDMTPYLLGLCLRIFETALPMPEDSKLSAYLTVKCEIAES